MATRPRHAIRVALDATPLIGERTGVGVLTAGVVQALAALGQAVPAGEDLGSELDLRAFALTWRGRRHLAAVLPPSVRAVRRPMAATGLQRLWAHGDRPVVEWWTGPVEVVHGTNFVVPPAARAARIVTVHDLTAIRFPELCQPATLRYPALIRRAVERGAWVHTYSQAMAAEVVELIGAPPERVRVVAPGPPSAGEPWVGGPTAGSVVAGSAAAGAAAAAGSASSESPSAESPSAESPSPESPSAENPSLGNPTREGRPFVLSLGRAEPRKDLPLLVRAFDEVAAHHPDLDLVLAGPPGWAEEALTAAIAGARHRDRIRRLGWVGDRQKAALLAGATVFAYPSVYEGFGIPPLEAMAAGVPVVATAAGGVPEAVGPAALLVPVGDGDALAAGLTRLLDDPGARARLVAAGHEQVARFSWSACARGLLSLYRDAAAAMAAGTATAASRNR